MKEHVAETYMLRGMCRVTRKDRIGNKHKRENLRVAPIGEKIQQYFLKWYVYTKDQK